MVGGHAWLNQRLVGIVLLLLLLLLTARRACAAGTKAPTRLAGRHAGDGVAIGCCWSAPAPRWRCCRAALC
ncbi:hypothetical protein M8494_05070 [Serratia ureilytica]